MQTFLQGVSGTVFFIVNVVVGLLQLAAMISGVEAFLGVGETMAIIISFCLTYIPVVGGLLGTYGAVEYWDWDWWWAALLFFWQVPYLIIYVVFAPLIFWVSGEN